MHLSVSGLAGKRGVPRDVLAGEYAALVVFLRLVAQQEDDLALYVQARVVIVMVFRRGNSIARKHHRARDPGRGGDVERDEISWIGQSLRAAVLSDLEAVGLAQTGADNHLKRLVVGLAGNRL